MNKQLTKEEIIIDNVWHNRSPTHEINADSGEDMFYGTMRICMSEYAKQTAITFLDSIRDYIKESHCDIASDDRSSEEFYNLFLKEQ